MAENKLVDVVGIVQITVCLLGLTLGSVELNPSGIVKVPRGSTVKLVCTLKNDTNSHVLGAAELWAGSPYFLRMPPTPNQNLTVEWLTSDTMMMEIRSFSESDSGLYICGSHHAGFETVTLDLGSEIPHSCSPKMLECLGRCIPWRFVCDHVDDCEDRSDELGCDVNCTSMFICNNGQCIDPAFVCDNFHSKNCRDGSDELNCDGLASTVRTYKVVEYDHGSWHFNIIYGVIAGVIGLVCVVGIVLVTICRIHMRREAMTRTMGLYSARHRRPLSNIQWQENHLYYTPADLSDDTPCYAHSPLTPPSLSINVNLQMAPGELAGLIMPPSYSEVEQMGEEEGKSLPPPYSALDSQENSPGPSIEAPHTEVTQPPPSYTEISQPIDGTCHQGVLNVMENQEADVAFDVTFSETDSNQAFPPQ